MSAKNNAESFLNNLEKVANIRQKFATYLGNMAKAISDVDLQSFSREIQDLELATQNLREGVFRLMVLGDMKRGKSTFLNALIGENLLPSDVNPCTAVLTKIRFGQQKQVTIYFTDGNPPQVLDFETFKREYTIDPQESKNYEDENKQAFPNVEYAVVEYPLVLLEKGVEIVDSPGLNDTEARNQLTLTYINNCHAILFVLSATQQFTLGERRYLENYIKQRGLTVFFLINAWDLIAQTALDPTKIEEAENKVRQVYKSNLLPYCQVEGEDIYDDRVFEISARNALRLRLQDSSYSLDGTGFPEFIGALNVFLTQERAISELRQARSLARQTHRRVHEYVECRIPLLSQSVDELKQKIHSVQPEFDRLVEIRDKFKDEIARIRDEKTDTIIRYFVTYVKSLGQTFEEDFGKYQPKLSFIGFLRSGKRKEFEETLKASFGLYLNDKIADWSFHAETEMDFAFSQLAIKALQYGASYNQTTDRITQKLTGKSLFIDEHLVDENNKSPGWANWAAGIFSAMTGNIGGLAMAGTGLFNWKQIMINLGGVIAVNAMVLGITGGLLGPLGIALVGLGFGGVSANNARKEMISTMKKELQKHLPRIASEKSEDVRKMVQDCFNTYGEEVIQRINEDIQSRKQDLATLLKDKELGQVNYNQQAQCLRDLDNTVLSLLGEVEDCFDTILQGKT